MKKRSAGSRKGGRPRGGRRKTVRPGAGLKALIGLFASPAGDLASRHDDYLYGWKKPAP